MNKIINLTPEERSALISQHKEARRVNGNTNLAYRINAILLLDDGLTIMQVAKNLLLDDETIRSYVNKYLSGKDTELTKLMYNGKSFKLNNEQIKELELFVQANIYQTVAPIIAYVAATYQKNYSVSGMTYLLHTLGFSYKQPKLVGAKANQSKQEEFIDSFTELYSKADLNTTAFVFADGVHPQHNTCKDYGWIKTEEAKYIKCNTGRERLNVLACVDVDNKNLNYCVDSTINAYTVINLLDKLQATHADKKIIYFFSDNAKYFHSKIVQDYLSHKNCLIKMRFLPAYSPNLNVIERLWSIMRKEILSNQFYEKYDDFRYAVSGFLSNCWTSLCDQLTRKLSYNFHKLPAHAYA